MATLTGRSPKDTYGDLLQVSNANDGVDSTLRFVSDGKGTNSSLKISSASAQFTGTLTSTGLLTTTAGIVSGSDIISDTDSTDDLGSTGVRWLNLWVDNITMGGTIAGAVATFSSTMTVTGLTTATGGIVTSGTIIFEGATADAHETTLTVVDPTGDRTVSLPNATDTLVGKATTDTLTNKTLTSPVLNTGLSGTAFLDEDNMASNSATKAASQQSIKAYVDAQVDTADTLSEVLAIGNTTGGTDVSVSTDDKVQFRDAAIYINSSADGQLDIVADTEIQIAATTVDINGAVALNGAITGATNITLSGELDAATGDFSGDVDVDGTLEADAITLGGTALGSIYSPIAGSSSIVTTGALNAGSITSGFGTINNGASAITTTGVGSFASLDISGDIDVDGTTNLDVVDIDGAVNMAATAVVIGVLSTTAEAVFNGGFASNADSIMGTNKKIKFRDAAIYINSSADGQLDIVADTEIQIAATTIDINGAINASGEIIAGSLDISGAIDVDGTSNLDVVDIDGAVDMASTLIVAGNINAVAGGINLGATGSANLLDDYEEGTWTPTLAGADTAGTYTVVTGTSAGYTKVGRLVHVGAKITLSAATGGSGVSILGGLPFNYASGSLPAGFISVSAVNLATANPASISLEPTSSGAAATLVFRESKDNAAVASTPIGGFSTSSVIHINMSYRV